MLKRTMMVVACVAALGMLGNSAYADNTLSITGTGTVKATPDEGYIVVGVLSHSEKSSTAVQLNATAMSNMFKTLAAFKIDKENIQTIEFSVSPHYKSVEYREENGGRHQKTVQDGFDVLNQVRVTVCELKDFGKVLDAVVESGANRVDSISFGSSKAESLLDEARAKACADALRKAGILAKGLNVNLGAVASVSESGGRSPRPAYRAAMNDAVATPISGGSLSFSVSVNVTWKLSGVKEKLAKTLKDSIKGVTNK